MTYLELNPTLTRASIFEKPNALNKLEQMGEPICYVLMIVSRLDRNFVDQVNELANNAPSADLP